MNYTTGPNQDPNVAGQSSGPSASGPQMPPAGYVPVAPLTPDPNPSLAASVLLGFIPGVGAMYNGQYAKALVHVVIFAIFVGLASNGNGFFGIFVAAWIAYMVFDSYHTARARRDGTPLPNPFGLNDAAAWFQGQRGARPWIPGQIPGQYGQQSPFVSGFTSAPPPPPPNPGAYYTPVPPVAYPVDPNDRAVCRSTRGPVGAIVLIALGVLFLLSTFNVLNDRWLAHGWPLLVIAFGIYLLISRLQPRNNNPRGDNSGGVR